jgi:hypothetical protein
MLQNERYPVSNGMAAKFKETRHRPSLVFQARRIAANIAKLPELQRPGSG